MEWALNESTRLTKKLGKPLLLLLLNNNQKPVLYKKEESTVNIT